MPWKCIPSCAKDDDIVRSLWKCRAARSNMRLYKYTNIITGRAYYGISKNVKQRNYSHAASARREVKTPFYDAVRKYGWTSFTLSISNELTTEQAQVAEIILIAITPNYNLHKGGGIGFSMLDKNYAEVLNWRKKLSRARKGRTPAKGMSHTEENRQFFSECGKLRWDLYGRYPEEVIKYSFRKAKEKFGISKTHYYRLKRSLRNDQ